MVNGGLMINNQSMMVNGGSWWFMNVHDCSWWFGNKPWLIASTRSHATPSTNNWNNTKIFKPSWKDYFTKHESTMFWRWSRDVRLQTWCLLLSLCFFAKNSSKLESPATHFTPSQQKKRQKAASDFWQMVNMCQILVPEIGPSHPNRTIEKVVPSPPATALGSEGPQCAFSADQAVLS